MNRILKISILSAALLLSLNALAQPRRISAA